MPLDSTKELLVKADSPMIIPIPTERNFDDIERPLRHKNLGSSGGQKIVDGLEDDLWMAMSEHMAATKRLMNCNLTLDFKDKEIEQSYTNFMGEKYKRSWSFIGLFGIVFMIIFQIVFYLIWNRKGGELALEVLIVPIVYLPCLLITAAVYTFNPEWIARWIQLLAAVYIIFVGPVFVVCKTYLLSTFHPLVSAAFYITTLFCFTYFLRLRFMYCLLVCFVAFPVWLIVAILKQPSALVV